MRIENLTALFPVAFHAGAKQILLPMASVGDIPSTPGELFAKFQTSFYADPSDAVFKALGVERCWFVDARRKRNASWSSTTPA